MQTVPAFLKGQHPYAFRAGEQAEVVGFKVVTPDGHHEPRPCFEVKYEDGKTDFVPLSSLKDGSYAIVGHTS